MRALIDGRFDDAESLAEEALAGGERAQEPVSAMFYAIQDSQLRRLRARPEDVRRLEESLPVLGDFVERYPAIPAWRCSLAATQALLGHVGEARAVFEPLAANDFNDLPRDQQWAISLALLAETAAFLGDAPRAERLYQLLLPLDGLVIVGGRAAVSQGPIARVLGAVAAATGRTREAVRHIGEALEMSDRMGDRPMSARTRLQLAELLLGRGEPGDRERALELLTAALETAQDIGMVGLTEEALAARLEAQGLTGLDTTTSIDFMIEAISSERPDIAAHAAPDGQVTILFSDIEDSTLMTERLGDERWLEVLRAHNSLFRRIVPTHGGYEVKNQGDGFMLVFPDSRRALECAVAIQRALAEGDPVEGQRVRVRMGMHAGEAIREEGLLRAQRDRRRADRRPGARRRDPRLRGAQGARRGRGRRPRRARLRRRPRARAQGPRRDAPRLPRRLGAGGSRVGRRVRGARTIRPVSQRTGFSISIVRSCSSVIPPARRSGSTRWGTILMSQSFASPAASICSTTGWGNQSIVAHESAEMNIRSA